MWTVTKSTAMATGSINIPSNASKCILGDGEHPIFPKEFCTTTEVHKSLAPGHLGD